MMEMVLSIIGAAAWIPILIEIMLKIFRRIHCVYLDRHIVYNVTNTSFDNGRMTQSTGMIVILALNLFVYDKPYFPKEIKCEVKLKDNAVHEGICSESVIEYTDVQNPYKKHRFVFPVQSNINFYRSLTPNTDNVRILPFFIENINMRNDDNIKSITLKFKGRILTKKIVIKHEDCVNIPFINQYNTIVG